MPRDRVEQHVRLDASELAWCGVLDARWSAGGGETPRALEDLAEASEAGFARRWAAVQLSPIASRPRVLAPDRVRLVVGFEVVASTVAGLGSSAKATFDLVAVPAHFGGARWWFECRCCGKRRAHLYFERRGVSWACRECRGLTYASRARYGRSARYGEGWGALSYLWDQHDAKCDALERRNARRGLGRYRQRHREAGRDVWPVAMTCWAAVRGAVG